MVPTYVIQLAGQCVKGVCYNSAQHLRDEFLINVRNSQVLGKPFHFSWILLLIALVTWKTRKGEIIPELKPGICEGAQYAYFWDSKDE